MIDYGTEHTCDHGEQWGDCPHGCARPPHFSDSLLRRSQLRGLPPVEPLIDGVLSLRSTAVFVGPTGAGKTIVAVSFACSVGTGHAWLGHPVKRVPVLYVVGEGAYGLDERVDAWERAWGQPVDDADVTFSVKPASLAQQRTWTQMADTAGDLGARLVILDTFSSLAPDADETKDAPRITRWLSDLAVTIDGTAVLVHHPGWGDAERTRGGYQLEANVDEVLLLRGNNRDPQISLERKKVKEGPAGALTWLRRKPMYDSVIVEQTTAAAAELPMRERILTLLAVLDNGPTGPQLCEELGVPVAKRSTVYKPLGSLRKDGKVTAEGKRGRERFYLAPEAPGE